MVNVGDFPLLLRFVSQQSEFAFFGALTSVDALFYMFWEVIMFLSLSKTLAKFGGVRFGVGIRVTKNNMIWMSLLVMFVNILKACWYMMILCFWLMYAMFYGMYWLAKKIFKGAKKQSLSSNIFSKDEHHKSESPVILQQQAENDLRIIADCTNLVQTTLNPDTFFTRLNLLVEKSKHLCELEGKVNFTGASPTAAYIEVKENYQEAINQFLNRYYLDVCSNADTLKTVAGKNGRYQKFYDSLQEYYQYMNGENISFIETKFKEMYQEK